MRDITRCPKCGSERIAFAHEEAPPWAKQWTKCFAYGKRWNLDGGPPKGKPDAEDENTEDVELNPPARVDRSQDIVALVMKNAREKPAQEPPTKERAMSSTSGDRQCTYITIHGTRCSQAATNGAIACKPHLGKVPDSRKPSMSTLPAKRTAAPIVLADPTIINPTPVGNGHNPALPAIDYLNDLIATFEANLVTLRGAKELLERHG